MKLLDEMESFCKFKHKIKGIDELIVEITPRPRKKKVIMCHGVFDVVHPGHIRHLIYAKSKGDILIVSLTADEHIIKGSLRPHIPEKLRAINLAALEMVDYVLIDKNSKPLENIKKIQPNFFAKGYEYINNGIYEKTYEEKNVLDEYGGEIIFTPGDIVYSSSKFIEMNPPKLSDDKLLILMESENITFKDLKEAIASLPGTSVHIVGDSIIDSYTYCDMIGGMTKTPTISLRYGKKIDYSGGAAVVAKHMKAAGANVTFSTVLGNDSNKNYLLDDLKKYNINCLPIIDDLRPTTNKNVYIVGKYKILKVDTVDNIGISEKILNKLISQIKVNSAEAVIFSDFRHGIFNSKTISDLINAIPENTLKVADSQVASRWGNIVDFKSFDLITPNEREARFSLGDQDSVIRHLANNLYKQTKAKTLMLKLGNKGLIVFKKDIKKETASFFLDSFAENIIDAVGAGDALLAYSTLAMIRTKSEIIAAILGSMAAAIECGRDGNIPVTKKDIEVFIDKIEKRVFYKHN